METINSADWAHDEEKLLFYDGEKTLKKPSSDVTIIVTENMPNKHATKYLKKGMQIFRVHGNRIADYRKSLGHPKIDTEYGDILDAKLIYDYYQLHPEHFKEYVGETLLQSLYASFKEIQKNRVATENRVWATGGERYNDFILKDLATLENRIKKEMDKELKKYPIWAWLQRIKGIGVATSGGLVAFIGEIENAPHVSSLWSYAGLTVVNGLAIKKRKGQTVNCHHRLKSLLLGVIADSFIKQRTPIYREIYDREKEKESVKKYPGGYLKEKYNGYKKTDIHLSKGHAHNRAMRKMMKIFLSHYWVIERQLHGLSTEPPYVHEKLKHNGYIVPPHVPESLLPFNPF